MEYLSVLYTVVILLASVELCTSKKTSYAECQFQQNKPLCHTRSLTLHEFPPSPGNVCLHLRGNKIERFPVNLSTYSMVPLLDVSLNKITSLPSDLTAMAKLEILNASYNAISTLSHITFPNSLEVLSLAGNKIAFLPAWSIPNLYVFELSNNLFTSIPETFCVSQNLLRVDLLGNMLDGDGSTYMRTLGSCKNSAGIPFCLFANWKTMKCNCDSILPLVYNEQTFCFGNTGRFEFIKCSEDSDSDFKRYSLYDVNSSLVQESCALSLMRSTSAPLNSQSGSYHILGFVVMLLFLKI
ncbi:hypothetical protein CHS0354_001429 [Potamilus streckersoni]|uniref:Uncharacterized protein n=1 Tax=Potamilus streckersoni TaxID=2493646 RepID=A0AAE0W8X3_9BIVA|nr:hypothetical protein CHS0354_001429 [Potamilus streckersoni]